MVRSFYAKPLIYLLCSAQVAWAAQNIEPTPERRAKIEAVNAAQEILRQSGAKRVDNYFAGQTDITLDSVVLFEKSFFLAVEAYARIQLIDDQDEFVAWWNENKTRLLKEAYYTRSNLNIQEFTFTLYTEYKAIKTRASEDPNMFIAFLDKVIKNKAVRESGAWVTGAALVMIYFIGNSIKGALIAGPLAAIMNGLTQPVVNPMVQKATLIGARILGRPGVWLNSRFFDEKKVENVKDQLKNTQQTVTDSLEMLRSMGHNASIEVVLENMARVQSAWNNANQVWISTQPAAYQNGRSLVMEAYIMRPRDLAQATSVGLQGAELFYQGIETLMDKIELTATTNLPPEQRQLVLNDLRAAQEELSRVMEKSVALANSKTEEIRALDQQVRAAQDRLVHLGATEAEVKRLADSYGKMHVSTRQAVNNLAAHIYHDFMYAEFNRKLPEEMKEVAQNMRTNFGLDYFHRIYAEQVVIFLEQMKFNLDVTLKMLNKLDVRNPDKKVVDKLNELSKKNQGTTDAMGDLKPVEAGAKGRIRGAIDRILRK